MPELSVAVGDYGDDDGDVDEVLPIGMEFIL